MEQKKDVIEFPTASQHATSKPEKKSLMRFRPKDQRNGAFYAPSADITNMMRGILKNVLTNIFETHPEEGECLSSLAIKLGEWMNMAILKGRSWEEDGIGSLEKLFPANKKELAIEFIHLFFQEVMDSYWHSIRLMPDVPEIQPDKMKEALAQSLVLRKMPKDMRDAYIEHGRTYNTLSTLLCEQPLTEEEKVDEEVK